nr:JmjC domain-containing protein [Tanacetum cinerariifolium]
MVALRYKDEHNKEGYLLKPTGIKQFWSTATLRSPELGPSAIQATIDKTSYTITEDLVRSRLQLADDGGIADLPIAEIYSGMNNLGPIVVALICLSDGRRFNWSSYILKGMVSNIGNAKKIFMYPRFLQAILGIETRIKRQYKVLMFSRKLFANMRLNFEGHPMPLLPAMLLQGQAVLEHGQSLDPNTASFSRFHETAAGPFTNIEEEPLGGSFNMSPPGSTQAPPAGQPSGGAEDPITRTVLSFVVSTLVQKVNSLETELKDHKKLFKDVVGKLVKKVKAMEVQLKTNKRKMVVSDSDQEEGRKQDVDLDALYTLANAAMTVDSNLSPGGASNNPTASTSVPTAVPTGATVVPAGASTIPPGTSTIPAGSLSAPTDVPSSTAPTGVLSKGKSPMVEEDIPVKARTFKQMEEDRLGEEAAKQLHEEEQAQMDSQRAEVKRKRQHKVLDSAMYYNKVDWITIRAHIEANVSLSKTLLGDDVSKDNFSVRIVTLIKRKRQTLVEKLAQERKNRPMTQAQQRAYMRQYVKNQSSAIYTTGWTMAYVKSFTDDQLKEEFEKICKVQSNSQLQAFSRTLKRTGPMLEEPSSISSVPDVPRSPIVSLHTSSGTRRKSLARKRLIKPKSTLQELDLDADAQTFIEVVTTKDSDDEALAVWSTLVGWEIIPTPLGDINALYRMDQSTKHFTTLRQILHMVDRQDLVKLYRLVVQYYETHLVAGAGLILWGDLYVLFDSYKGDVSYPLSVKVMEKMLRCKLEIDTDVVGNDMTVAEQLIQFIKNQLAAAQASSI